MKKIVFSSDTGLEKLAAQDNGLDLFISQDIDEVQSLANEHRCIVFIDFDSKELEPELLNESLVEVEDTIRVFLSETYSEKDFIKHQKSAHRAHLYCKKPIDIEILQGILSDIMFTDQEVGEIEEDEDIVEFQEIKAPEAPKAFQPKSDDAEKEFIEEQNLAPDDSPKYLESPLNQKIQHAFDTVFNNSEEETLISNKPQETPNDGVELSGDLKEFVIETTQKEIKVADVLNEPKQEQPETEELDMSDQKDDDFGLEFNIPIGDEGEKTEVPESGDADIQFNVEESDGLQFNLGEEEEPQDDMKVGEDDLVGVQDDEIPSSEIEFGAVESIEENNGELDLGEEGLELGAPESVSDETTEEAPGGIELDLGGDTTDGELELGAPESVSEEASSDLDFDINEGPGLDLGSPEEESSDIEFGLETTNEAPVEPEQTVGDLDLGDEEIAPAADSSEESILSASEDDLLNIPGAPTDEDMEITGSEEQDEDTGDIDISGIQESTNADVLTSINEFEFKNEGKEESTREVIDTPKAVESPPSLPGTTLSSIDQNELMRLQGLIRSLKEERESFLKEIAELKTEKRLLEQDNLGLQSELDEVKIEVEILKKRRKEELEEAQYQLRMSEDKSLVNEERYKKLKKEFDRMEIRFNEEVNKVKRREKELENQLELSSMDAENQVQSRDNVILDLKRKIDVLEFNMENTEIRERKSKEDKQRLELKLEKMMRTLRGSIKVLEDDLNLDQDILDEIKKL